MNNIEGQIEIDLHPHESKNSSVEIRSSRPVHASQVMIGKTPEQALTLMPLMFGICGVAQSRAALKAIMQQLEHHTCEAEESARDILVLTETAREQLLRIFMDWPELFATKRDNQLFPYITGLIKKMTPALFKEGRAFSLDSVLDPDIEQLQALIDELEQVLSTQVYQQALSEWLHMSDIADVTRWCEGSNSMIALSVRTLLDNNWENQGYPHSQSLPELEHWQLNERFEGADAEGFISQPDWHGHPFETTTLSRQQSHPLIKNLQHGFENTLITRWLARLVELASIPTQLRTLLDKMKQANPVAIEAEAEYGIAQVEAARGKLIHHVKVDGNAITQYQILAPTEWNFHPQGLVQQNLSHIQARDDHELTQISRLMINAIDPCVGYDLRIH